MTEAAPVETHHQITMEGKLLKYTASTGRLPIKRDDGKIEAESFMSPTRSMARTPPSAP